MKDPNEIFRIQLEVILMLIASNPRIWQGILNEFHNNSEDIG